LLNAVPVSLTNDLFGITASGWIGLILGQVYVIRFYSCICWSI